MYIYVCTDEGRRRRRRRRSDSMHTIIMSA
jgi:hypothetical protein